MTGEQENPYRVLDVERTADVRSIKKAYVALLRKFPPESHPAEFEKIRAAYELLQDADARARFDASEKGYAEYGADVSERLADVDKMIDKKNLDVARDMLLELTLRLPDARMVKEKLGVVHLLAGQPEKALAVFRELSLAEPENFRHHMSAARALGMLQKIPETEAALRAAHRLEPVDIGVALSLSGFLIGHRKAKEAEPVLDTTLAKLQPGSPPFFHILVRKVDMLAILSDDRLEGVVRELHGHVDAARKEHPELPSFVASELASTAAKLFAMNRPGEANALLARASTFNPESIIEHPLPPQVRVRTRELPEGFRAWLSRIEKGGQAGVVKVVTWPLPVLALLASAGLFLGIALGVSQPARESNWIGAVLGLGLAAIPLALCVRWCVRIVASPLRSFDALHPLYLVRVRPETTRLYSLLTLTETKGVHHHTNGVYTGTRLTLTFGLPGRGGQKAVANLSIRGKQLATDWLGLVSRVRTRALELLAEGALEAEELVDLLPPRTAAGLAAHPARRLGLPSRGTLLTALGALALSAPIALGLSMLSRSEGEADTLGDAAMQSSVLPYQRYLRSSAQPRYAREARAAEGRIFDRAIARLRASADPANRGATALISAVDAMRGKGAMSLHVEWAPASTPSPDGNALLTRHLERSLEGAGLSDVLASRRDTDAAAASVSFQVSCATESECHVAVKLMDASGQTAFEDGKDVRVDPLTEAATADARAEANALLVERVLAASTDLLGLRFTVPIPVRAEPLARAASPAAVRGGRP